MLATLILSLVRPWILMRTLAMKNIAEVRMKRQWKVLGVVTDGTLLVVDWGDEDCCGCLIVQVRGHQADMACNECSAVAALYRCEESSTVLQPFVRLC